MGVGETWRKLVTKCILKVTVHEEKEACGTDHLCGGMDVGVEGSINVMHLLWHQNAHEKDWGCILIDAHIAFNVENQTEILLTIRYELPSDAQFNFNCSLQWSTLVVHNVGGLCHFLHIKEGVTQV